MILTVTLNTSVDIRFTVEDFQKGGIFRAKDSQQTAGGKGLNVTRVLKQLSSPVKATGFIGGTNGQFIKGELDNLNIDYKFALTKENTRSCIAILDGETQTEVLGKGAKVTEEELEQFLEIYNQLLYPAKVVTFSGSLPTGVRTTIYRDLIKAAKKAKLKTILDTSGDPLKEALPASPDIIKPNKHELETLVERKLNTQEDIAKAMEQLASQYNIETIIVSLGSQGALAMHNHKLYKVQIPTIQAKNPVGSGDAMVAGLAHALNQDQDIITALTLGSACGMSNAMQPETGKIDKTHVEELLSQITITSISS